MCFGDINRQARSHANVALRLQLQGGGELVIQNGTQYEVNDISWYAARGTRSTIWAETRYAVRRQRGKRSTWYAIKLLLCEPLDKHMLVHIKVVYPTFQLQVLQQLKTMMSFHHVLKKYRQVPFHHVLKKYSQVPFHQVLKKYSQVPFHHTLKVWVCSK